MAGIEGMGDVNEAIRTMTEQAREAWGRFAEEVELERRMRESPMAVLGVAAAAGFVLGGGLWPAVRPFVKAAARTALTPANLLAIGAALGAMKAAGVGGDGTQRAEPEPEPGPAGSH